MLFVIAGRVITFAITKVGRDRERERKKKRKRTDTKIEANKIESNKLSGSNREKSNVAIAIMKKWTI